MKAKSKFSVLGLLLLGVIIVAGCGDDGPQGLKGPDGPRGDTGSAFTTPIPEDRVFSLGVFNGNTAHNGSAVIHLTADTSADISGNALIMDSLMGRPPVIDGVDDGPEVWGNHLAKIDMSRRIPAGDNFIYSAEMRAAYDRDYVYFLVRWTEADRDDPPFFVRANDQYMTWAYDYAAVDWSRNTGLRDDKVSLTWLLTGTENDSTAWNAEGCQMVCHAGKQTGMFTSSEDQEIDIWVWGSVTSDPIGFAVDGAIGYQAETEVNPNGFRSDAGSPVWLDNSAGDTLPAFQHKHGADYDGSYPLRYWEVDGFDITAPWADGATIPGLVIAAPSYSAADVFAKGRYENGTWTVEFVRARDTKNIDDVRF